MNAPDFIAAVDQAERQQTIADLKAARAELVSRGRTANGVLISSNGQVCALGAVGMATVKGFADEEDRDGWRYTTLDCARATRVIAELAKAVRIQAQLDCSLKADAEALVYQYNDDDTTTDQDVLDLFDKALAELGGLA